MSISLNWFVQNKNTRETIIMKAPNILIVDDNSDSRLAVRATLRKSNYAFCEAKNGEDALEIINSSMFDLIIMDIMMPGISGYDVLQSLKADERTKQIPVLIITALDSMDEKIRALEYGAEGLWTKPFDRLHLREQVETLVDTIEQKQKLDNILQRQSKELIRYYYTDALTGFPNRSQLIKDIDDATNSSLMLIDIDRFKDIVYFYGHEISDNFLKSFAFRIKNILDTKKYQHYRVSSDIFAILIKPILTKQEIQELMQDFSKEIESFHFQCKEHTISLTVTIGASMFQKELLISSEKALKTAKSTNKETMLYEEESERFYSFEQNIYWVEKIKHAIEDDNIIPYYQPIVKNITDEIEKYECLVRLKDRDNTIHSPFKFLDIAQKSRNYAYITKNMIKKTFEKFKNSKYQFSINLSAKDIVDNEISHYIYSQLENFNGCNRVVFEILESDGIENYDKVRAFIEKVKAYKCIIAIDDFGSGYSNFIHLLRLKVDIIKIDGSLIRDLDSDENAQIIVKSVVDFAKTLNIITVAEFVHSAEIHSIVKRLGVDYSQGYYLAEPKDDLI
jgi:diguanylate cyclase (GGDEF)-like protein